MWNTQLKCLALLASLEIVLSLPNEFIVPELQGTRIAGVPTPENCKALEGDSAFPAESVWLSSLKGAQKQEKSGQPHPSWLVTAKTIKDVETSVRFANQHNVRLTVINSGHDFLGRNDATSGLWLMVGNLKGLRVESSYTATTRGASVVDFTSDPISKSNAIKAEAGQQAAVTFGAGVTTQELNDALHKSGLFASGAASSTVKPAGGFSLNGGHSPFSSKYGLAADNVLEYQVVTADGALKIANAATNQDLFWALRGGGGNTFGIVVQATFKAWPSPKITQTKFWIQTLNKNDTTSIFDPSAYLHSKFVEINRQGWQGYYYIYPWGFWARFFSADTNVEEAKKTFAPILAGLSNYTGITQEIHQYHEFKSFKEFFDTLFGALPPLDPKTPIEDEPPTPRGISPMDSRLLGSSHLQSPSLSAALRDAMPRMENGQLRGHLVGGGAVMKDVDNSVNPAWRRAYVHLIATGKGKPNAASLKALAPDMGAYPNECSTTETNWKSTMWGSHYQRLEQIKSIMDPNATFWVTPGIGADNWQISEGRLCKTAAATQSLSAPVSDNKNPVGGGAGYKEFPKTQQEADEKKKGAAWP